ncbi:MAG TPA: VC0807 family protein [Caulobacteraceae bacterium]
MAEESVRARLGGMLRRNGRGAATELLVNFALPFAVYDLTKPRLGDAHALMVSSAPPIIWAIVEFVRRRRVDFISMFVLAGIALSLLAMLGGGSVKFLQLRERLVTAVIGLAFVISALIRRPLIYEFARASMRRNQSDQLAQFEARRNEAGFRRAMTTMTLVWGFGLLAEAAVSVVLVLKLTIKQYLIVSPIVGYSVAGILTLWTFAYVRALRRRGEARRKAEAEAAAASQDHADPVPQAPN